MLCGDGSLDDAAVTRSSLLDGSNACRLAGILQDGVRQDDRSARPRWQDTSADHLIFVPVGGFVVPGGLERLGAEIDGARNDGTEIELAYVDDVGFPAGNRNRLMDPVYRPGFSPDRLRAQMYLGEMVVLSRRLASKIDPDGTELSAPLPHHLAVAAGRQARAVLHVPEVLFHRRLGLDLADVSRHDDLNDTATRLTGLMAEQGFPAAAVPTGDGEPGCEDGVFTISPRLERQPMVSIVIPTNGARRFVDGADRVLAHHAVSSILEKTDYDNYELVIVISPGGPPDLIGGLRELVRNHRSSRLDRSPDRPAPSIRFCHDQRTFNFSNASNRGAAHAEGEVLVFLNDDVRVIGSDWLERLVLYADQPDIGAVGPALRYEDGSIQHAGIWTRGGHPTHRYEGFPGDHPGYRSSLLVPQNCLAVTGACLAVTAQKFNEVGGFSPRFPSSYNDVDLCLKLLVCGYRTVIDPGAKLVHYGSSSRDPGIEDWELALLHERWRSIINRDPFDNPNHLAPQSDEYPPPDAVLIDLRRRSGVEPPQARRWPLPMTIEGATRAPAALTAGPGPDAAAPDASPAPPAWTASTAAPIDAARPATPADAAPVAAPADAAPVGTAKPGAPGPLMVEVKTTDPSQ